MTEASSGNSTPPFQLTFKEIVVVLGDGNEMLMNKCLNCGFVTRANSFSKLAHWRSCPSKMLFRYINQNDGKRGYTVICIACRTEVHCTSAFQMSQHYHKKCTRHTLGDMNYTDFTTEFDENDESGEIEYTSEDTVSQREIDGQRKLHMNHDVGSLADGFKFKYSSTPSGLRRCAECQQCMKRLGRPFGAKLTAHRRVCPLVGETLISVCTDSLPSQNGLSPFDMTISSSIIDDEGGTTSAMANTMRICFICNTTSSESFVSLYDTVSEHSKTQIFDFVWKFLDDQPTVRDDSIDGANSNWSLVCARCLNKINQYDLACMTATRLEQELRDELAQTEAFYSGRERIDEPNEEYERIDETSEEPQQIIEPNQINQTEMLDDPLDVTINLDSPPSIQIDTNEENKEANDQTDCIIELSDEEGRGDQAIELSDDE